MHVARRSLAATSGATSSGVRKSLVFVFVCRFVYFVFFCVFFFWLVCLSLLCREIYVEDFLERDENISNDVSRPDLPCNKLILFFVNRLKCFARYMLYAHSIIPVFSN